MTSLHLGTVLILHETSLLAGAGTLLLVWLRAERPPGVAMIATAFFLLAVGAILAGLGEVAAIPAAAWQSTSAGLGVGAYTLFFLGMRRLDRSVGPLIWLLLLGLGTVLVGVATPIFADNEIRATVFHCAAAAANLGAGLGLRAGRRTESLPSRSPLAFALLACGSVYGLQIPLLLVRLDSPGTLALALSATMMLNFAIAALVVSFVRERREEAHRRVSLTDALTGVRNRQGFLAQVPERLAAGTALAVLDLDHFKAINDRLGHAAGDHMLAAFARLIESRLWRGEILARIGGEEFVVYFPESTGYRARAEVEAMRAATQAADIPWQGQPVRLSVSVGLVISGPEAGQDRATLLARADAALYRAKAAGRNRVLVAHAPPRVVDHAAATLAAM